MKNITKGSIVKFVYSGLERYMPFLACIFSLSYSQPSFAKDETTWYQKSQVDCLVENYKNYFNSDKELIIVFLSLCPDANPKGAIILQDTKNSSIIKIKQKKSSLNISEILVLTKKQLKCLGTNKSYTISSADNPHLVRIDLARCV